MTQLPDPATFSRRADQRSAGRTRFVATGAQTRGDFGLFEVTMPPGGRVNSYRPKSPRVWLPVATNRARPAERWSPWRETVAGSGR